MPKDMCSAVSPKMEAKLKISIWVASILGDTAKDPLLNDLFYRRTIIQVKEK